MNARQRKHRQDALTAGKRWGWFIKTNAAGRRVFVTWNMRGRP